MVLVVAFAAAARSEVPPAPEPTPAQPAESTAESAPEEPPSDALADAIGGEPAPVAIEVAAPAPVLATPAPPPLEPSPATPVAPFAPEDTDEPIILEPSKDKRAADPVIVEDDGLLEAIELAPVPPPVAAAPVDTDVGVEIGWNSPTPQGIRLLRRLDGTDLSFGLGVGFLTFWGPKLSVFLRGSSAFESGFFWQVALAFTRGAEFEQFVEGRFVTFERTPGRTLDGNVGYRFRTAGGGYLELLTGWSANITGTILQKGKPAELAPIDDFTRAQFWIQQPGGFVLGVSYGWLF